MGMGFVIAVFMANGWRWGRGGELNRMEWSGVEYLGRGRGRGRMDGWMDGDNGRR